MLFRFDFFALDWLITLTANTIVHHSDAVNDFLA